MSNLKKSKTMDLREYFKKEYENTEFFNAEGEEATHFLEGEEATHFAEGKIPNRPSLVKPNMVILEETPTPIIISLNVTDANNLTTLEILNAIRNATLTNPHQPTPNITISYDVGGYTYKDFLGELLGGFVAQISKMEILCSNTNVLLAPIKVRQTNILGEEYSKPIIPRLNSFQNLANQIEVPTNFYLTKTTALVLTFPANTAFTVTYRLYAGRISSHLSTLNAGQYVYRQIPQSGFPLVSQQKVNPKQTI